MIINKRVNNKRYFALVMVAILLVAIITVTCLLVFLPKSDSIQYDIVYDGVEANGLIIRNENFVSLDGYEKLVYENVIEGQFLQKDAKIVSAYKKGYIKNTIEKLSETEKSIVTYQNQNVIVGFDDKNLQQIDFYIEVCIGKMSQQHSGFIELYGELCRLMAEREQYIRDNYNIDSDVYLKELYADEENLLNSLEPWCDQLVAATDGFIGFMCDGAETVSATDKALSISYVDVRKSIKEGFSNELNGYKLVSDGKWYVVVEIDDISQFSVGNYFPLYINNEIQSESAYLERIIDEKKGTALVFSIQDNVERYLDLRVTSVFIGDRYEGFSVENKFVKDNNIIIKNGKEKVSIPVQVLYSDKKRTVFTVNDQVNLGQKVYNK